MSSKYYITVVSDDVEVCKMYDLEVGKEYFIDRLIETKFGYICVVNETVYKEPIPETNNELIDQLVNDTSHLKSPTQINQIKFYANRSLNNYIKDNKIEKFYLRINAFKECTIDDKKYKYPLYDVAIVRRIPDIFISEDFENIIS